MKARIRAKASAKSGPSASSSLEMPCTAGNLRTHHGLKASPCVVQHAYLYDVVDTRVQARRLKVLHKKRENSCFVEEFFYSARFQVEYASPIINARWSEELQVEQTSATVF